MDLRITSLEEYHQRYSESIQNPASFWSDIAGKFLWKKPFDEVLEWEFDTPRVKWFLNGQLNITENALDRHVAERGDQAAIIWEPNDPADEAKTISYRELHARTCQFANALKTRGVQKGDRVILYMPMVPELAIATLACARIGAVHSIVFAGFSSKALADRIQDAQAKVVITADGLKRGPKQMALKAIVDDALATCPSVTTSVVFQHTSESVQWESGRDIWWHDVIAGAEMDCDAEAMDSEDMLFILYTSGSTGKPKGVVHTCGGYMVYTAYSFQNVFQYEPGDVYWCTADLGWITGHSYIVYGPLLSGATTIMFEGIPTWPDAGRFWQVCERHRVNQFYTAPTAIRSLMVSGEAPVKACDLSSLKVLGSVGEPINEEAWHWYHKHVGDGRCPVVDTWWQTETGGIMLSGLGDFSPMKPAHAGWPLPGIQPVLLTAEGELIEANEQEGLLCIRHPWPSMIRTTYGDHERCREVYFSMFKDHYFTGDGAKRDKNGLYRIIGRVDDVINVSGHRFGTAEIEDAINTHSAVVESAVVGFPHDVKGSGIHAYVICQDSSLTSLELRQRQQEITESVEREIGKIARPDRIQFVSGLPKTRSGKIMRRILRKIAEGQFDNFGDVSTLVDPAVVDEIVDGMKKQTG